VELFSFPFRPSSDSPLPLNEMKGIGLAVRVGTGSSRHRFFRSDVIRLTAGEKHALGVERFPECVK
jgi:hypothetical protein